MRITKSHIILGISSIGLLAGLVNFLGIYGFWVGVLFILLNFYLLNRIQIRNRYGRNQTIDRLLNQPVTDFYLKVDENLPQNSEKQIKKYKNCPDCKAIWIEGTNYCDNCGFKNKK